MAKKIAAVKYESLQENRDFYAEALSKSVRILALGIIAAIWAISTASGVSLGTTALFGLPTEVLIQGCFVCSGGMLLLDALQYIAGYWTMDIGMDNYDKREAEGETVEFYYNQQNLGKLGFALYWSNIWLFSAKLVLAISGGLSFLALAFAIKLGN